MRCHFCCHELIWSCDYDAEELGYEGEGVVAQLTCSNEQCQASWEGVWLKNKD
ncbi:MAG: hypothetical protein ACRC0F_00285 [Cetobacterium sp.]